MRVQISPSAPSSLLWLFRFLQKFPPFPDITANWLLSKNHKRILASCGERAFVAFFAFWCNPCFHSPFGIWSNCLPFLKRDRAISRVRTRPECRPLTIPFCHPRLKNRTSGQTQKTPLPSPEHSLCKKILFLWKPVFYPAYGMFAVCRTLLEKNMVGNARFRTPLPENEIFIRRKQPGGRDAMHTKQQ